MGCLEKAGFWLQKRLSPYPLAKGTTGGKIGIQRTLHSERMGNIFLCVGAERIRLPYFNALHVIKLNDGKIIISDGREARNTTNRTLYVISRDKSRNQVVVFTPSNKVTFKLAGSAVSETRWKGTPPLSEDFEFYVDADNFDRPLTISVEFPPR